MNGIIERYFGNSFTTDTKFRIHNVISKTAVVAKPWTIKKKRNDRRMEAAQMRYLIPLLGFNNTGSPK